VKTSPRSAFDERLLERAFALAERGRYGCAPNPMVGAVVARGARVVGEGHHRRTGGPHAEMVALRRAGALARGADLYLTLEPCVHEGRTPPCAPAVVASGVARVIVAARDPDPRVHGRGLAALRRAGVRVVLAGPKWRKRGAVLNEKFAVYVKANRPFVLAKWASSLDGRIASVSGESRWITGGASRRLAMLLREEYDAVLVGAGTVRADDPRLTRRLGRNRSRPQWRIVLDGRLRAPESALVFRGSGERVLVTAMPASHPKARRLAARGIRVWSLPGGSRGRVDLPRLMAQLASHEVSSLMVEGGGGALWSFFGAGLVDRVAVFLAPRILGGVRAPGSLGGKGFSLAATPWLEEARLVSCGRDVLVTGRLRGGGQPPVSRRRRV
jgi:diaminohydroxyphosphoribosylaminopyrimidine deaminase/5-amino-6-(5-phosphoribosylamino)uracil reductase